MVQLVLHGVELAIEVLGDLLECHEFDGMCLALRVHPREVTVLPFRWILAAKGVLSLHSWEDEVDTSELSRGIRSGGSSVVDDA